MAARVKISINIGAVRRTFLIPNPPFEMQAAHAELQLARSEAAEVTTFPN
jgi:hypothetical protein